MLNASLWVLIAFCILILVVGRPVWRTLATYLDQHSFKIRGDLQEAKQLYKEALGLVNEAKRLQAEAAQHAQEIVSHAKIQAEVLQKTSQTDLEVYIKLEERLLLERLAQIEAQALTEIKNKALDAAISASRQALSEVIAPKDQDQLFEEALDHIKNTSLKTNLL
jgi:F-type H+-transporting ATPase subunit b